MEMDDKTKQILDDCDQIVKKIESFGNRIDEDVSWAVKQGDFDFTFFDVFKSQDEIDQLAQKYLSSGINDVQISRNAVSCSKNLCHWYQKTKTNLLENDLEKARSNLEVTFKFFQEIVFYLACSDDYKSKPDMQSLESHLTDLSDVLNMRPSHSNDR